ncbi:MAG: hypothetical protein ACPG1A_07240 [Halioglobus sp.]
MEAAAATMYTYGAALLLMSWVMLIITAWREDYAWGLCSLFLPPLAYLYAFARLDKAGEALVVAALGWVCIFIA